MSHSVSTTRNKQIWPQNGRGTCTPPLVSALLHRSKHGGGLTRNKSADNCPIMFKTQSSHSGNSRARSTCTFRITLALHRVSFSHVCGCQQRGRSSPTLGVFVRNCSSIIRVNLYIPLTMNPCQQILCSHPELIGTRTNADLIYLGP